MLPNKCELTFKVKVHTNSNQDVRIVGNIDELGAWKPSQGFELTTNINEYPYWSNSKPLTLLNMKETRFEFKIVVFENNYLQRWETLPDNSNRKYKIKFSKVIVNFNEGDPLMRETIIEKLPEINHSESQTMDNKVIKKKNKDKVPFNPFDIADSDDDDDDESDNDSGRLEEGSPSFSLDSVEEFDFNINLIKSSFYHCPPSQNTSVSQKIDHAQNMKDLYNQMRSQTHNRLWHLSSRFTFHDAFYGVHEEDLTIFEEQETVYIVTFYLPITINTFPDNSYEIKLNYIHESLALYEYCKKYQKNRFLWIGLHKQIPSKIKEEVEEILATEYCCCPIYLNHEMYDKFKYECKNYLWCHLQKIDIANKFEESKDFWTTYELVNYRIAEKILSIYDKGYVLINDYRFLLVPNLCTKQKPSLKLHYVLNFPFPSPNSFFCIPFYPQIINSILLSWVLSFESHDDMSNFVDTVQKLYGGRLLSQSGYLTLQLYGRFIILNANAQLKREYLLSKKGEKPIIQKTLALDRKASLHLDFEFAQVVFISVDHATLRGGIESKFKALEQLFLANPEMVGKIKLIQIFKLDSVNDEKKQTKILKQYTDQAASINEKFSIHDAVPIQIISNDFQDPKWIEPYYQEAHCFIDTNMDKSHNASLRKFLDYKEGKAVIIINEGLSDRYADFPFTFTVNPVSINDITNQLRDCFDIIVNLNETISCNLYNGRLPLNYVEEWLIKSNMTILKANVLMRNAKIFNTYVLSKSNTHDYMLAACSANFKKPNFDDISIKYVGAAIRMFIFPLEILLTNETIELLKINESAVNKITSRDVDPDIYKIIESVAKYDNNIVAIITKKSKTLMDNTVGNLKNVHLIAENGCFYKHTQQGFWVNVTDENFSFKPKVRAIMTNYQKRLENFKIREKESELKLTVRGNFNSDLMQRLLINLQKELMASLGENNKIEVVRFENSVCVRPYNVNKGTITQILLQRTFQEKGKIGFLFCIGKTQSDEEIFAGISRSVKMSQEIFTEIKHLFTCAVGHRPSHAAYYVNTKDEIKSLLKNFLI